MTQTKKQAIRALSQTLTHIEFLKHEQDPHKRELLLTGIEHLINGVKAGLEAARERIKQRRLEAYATRARSLGRTRKPGTRQNPSTSKTPLTPAPVAPVDSGDLPGPKTPL